MSVLNKIEKREIRDLLGKGWLTHDGMWFYHTYQELGIEKANKLNKAAIRSLAPIEIKRVKKALGIKYSIYPKIDKCIMHEKGACSGDIKVIFDDSPF